MTGRLAIVTCIAAVMPGWLAAVSLPAAADSSVQVSLPAQNFGSLPQLTVDSGHITYLKFDLAAVTPPGYSGGTIQRAILYLYASRVTNAGQIALNRSCSSWSETALMYANRPIECPEGSTAFNVAVDNSFVAVEITKLAQLWLDGVFPNDGIILGDTSHANGAALFDSKENTTTSHIARLEITFTGAPGTTGPTGVQGPLGPFGPPGSATLSPVSCTGGLGRVNAAGSSTCVCPPVTYSVTATAFGNGGTVLKWQGNDTRVGSGSCTMTLTEPSGRIDGPANPSWKIKSSGSYSKCAVIGSVPDCAGDIGFLGTDEFPACTNALDTSLNVTAKAFVFCN